MEKILSARSDKSKTCAAFILWVFLAVVLADPYYHWNFSPSIVHMLFSYTVSKWWINHWHVLLGIHAFLILLLSAYLLPRMIPAIKRKLVLCRTRIILGIGILIGAYEVLLSLLMMIKPSINPLPEILSFSIPMLAALLVAVIQWGVFKFRKRADAA